MRDVYVEWMVSKKRSFMDNFMRVLGVVVAVISFLLFSLTANIICFLITVAGVAFCYFAFTYTNVEYEYIFITGEFAIDRILSKAKRKRIEKFDVERIEVIAPLKSPRLGGFENKKYREYDYTSGERTQNSHIFVMYAEGKKILFEPSKEMFDALRDVLPHKVHMN